MMKVAYIDHYDSFSFNLIDWLERDTEIGVTRIPYDDHVAMARLRENPCPLVLSPGPKAPQDAPETLQLLEQCLGYFPIFGVCLGHQMLAYIGGAAIVRSRFPRHGATRQIQVTTKQGLFLGMKDSFLAAAYNSLTVDDKTLPAANFSIIARCENNEVQAIEYRSDREFAAFGVQFHPESFLSESQDMLRQNWGSEVRRFYSHK